MSKIKGRYTPLRDAILDCPAWRAMSMGARALYVAIRRRAFNDGSNNGQVRFSNRQAQHELGSRDAEVTGWFRELRHYGFIVLASKGYLGGEGRGVASSWRITELPTPDGKPTDDYLRWDGELFVRLKKKSPSRKTGTPRPGKQGHSRPGKQGHSAKNPAKPPSLFSGTSLEYASHAEGNGAAGGARKEPLNGARVPAAASELPAIAILVKRTDLPPAGSDWPKNLRPLPVRGAASIGMQSAATCLQMPVEAVRPLQRAQGAPDVSPEYGPSAAVITPPVYIAPAAPSTDAGSVRLLRKQVDAVNRRRQRELKLLSRKLREKTVR